MMQRFDLLPHPLNRPQAPHSVEVIVRDDEPGWLRLDYRIVGVTKVVTPPRAPSWRTDGLWQTTCFELFVQAADGSYLEFNFSPSTEWAAYRFGRYRQNMAPLALRIDPRISPIVGGIVAECSRADLPPGPLRIALAAVVEEEGGGKTFWALAHPPGQPDFHNIAGFTATLPEARAA